MVKATARRDRNYRGAVGDGLGTRESGSSCRGVRGIPLTSPEARLSPREPAAQEGRVKWGGWLVLAPTTTRGAMKKITRQIELRGK